MRLLLFFYMYLFIHRPFEIWPTLGVFRIELIYMLIVGCFWFFNSKKSFIANPLNFGFGLFVTCVIICWVNSPWTEDSFNHVYKYLTLVIFFVVLVTSINDEKGLRQLVDCLLLIFMLYMLHSLWEFKNGKLVHRMGIDRLIGVDATMGDPNAFGSNLLYVLALVPASWVGNRSKCWRGFLILYTCTTIGCIGLTGSRGSFVALVFATVLTIARSRHRWVFALLALIACPIFWAALPPSLQNRFETIIHPEVGPANAQVSAEGRLEGLRMGAQLWSEYPLTGCGPGAWKVSTGSKLESHNLYGQVIGETGFLGSCALGIVIFLFFWNYLEIRIIVRARPVKPPDYLSHLADCLAIATLLLLLNGVFSHNLFRYTWLWYGGFLIITRHCALTRKLATAVSPPVRIGSYQTVPFRRFFRRPA